MQDIYRAVWDPPPPFVQGDFALHQVFLPPPPPGVQEQGPIILYMSISVCVPIFLTEINIFPDLSAFLLFSTVLGSPSRVRVCWPACGASEPPKKTRPGFLGHVPYMF